MSHVRGNFFFVDAMLSVTCLMARRSSLCCIFWLLFGFLNSNFMPFPLFNASAPHLVLSTAFGDRPMSVPNVKLPRDFFAGGTYVSIRDRPPLVSTFSQNVHASISASFGAA